jgi:hypothetical protein
LGFEFVSDFEFRISDLALTGRLTPGRSPWRRKPTLLGLGALRVLSGGLV